jgi:choline dehydrogenase-like flavoprotein
MGYMVDTLIVGSGIAAAAVAQSILTKNPSASVVLLEAGSKVKTKDFGLWEHYLITGQLPYDPYKDLQYPQNDLPGENMSVGSTDLPLAGGRVMTYGGSTIHWGGWSFRLKPEDFRLHENTGHAIDWPFGYDILEPYYGKAEHFIGVSGDSKDATVPRASEYPFPEFPYTLQDRPIAQACDSLGIAYSHVPIARHGVTDTTSKQAPCQTTGTCKYCPFGARFAATDRLKDMAAWNDYPEFAIHTGTVVQQILMSSRKRASGVLVRRADGHTETIEAARIVIAAGTIESAKLLQRSMSQYWTKGIGNDRDLVGRYLVTHPYFIFKGTRSGNPLNLQKEMDFPTWCSRHFDSEGEQQAGKFILVNPPDTVEPKITSLMRKGMSRAEIDKAIIEPKAVALHGMLEVFGQKHNRVSEMPDKPNRLGLTQTIVDYSKARTFDRRMADIHGHVKRIFAAMDVADPGKPSISWRADHASSTCRMATSSVRGVVDPNLRVHGVDNVFVCSNAVFPSTGAVNPTLTLTALALRLGDHLTAP